MNNRGLNFYLASSGNHDNHLCKRNLAWKEQQTTLAVLFRCLSTWLDQMTGQYSRGDGAEDGTYAEHFLEPALPFGFMETV